jgi:tRNA(fMet)-specific endonuclease VapC
MALRTQYSLDTNILLHCVRDDRLWAAIRDDYQLLLIEPTPIISAVTSGELRSLALQFGWGAAKLDRMEFILGYFIEIPVESGRVVTSYATIDAHFHTRGQPMGKNDLGIAATAVASDATLLTTDRDFDRLHPHFLMREWIWPQF